MCARCNCRLLAVPPYLPLVCSNVLLDGSLGTAKICDLGQSGILQASIVTAHGTPNRYSSPEQLAGGWCGPASDIYSLGIVMLEVLTGHAARGRDARAELQLRCAVLCAGLAVCPIWPWRGMQEVFAVSHCHQFLHHICMCRVPEHCPLAVAELAYACLDRDPTARPGAKHVVAVLQDSSEGAAAGIRLNSSSSSAEDTWLLATRPE